MKKGARRFPPPDSMAHDALFQRAGGCAARLPPGVIPVTSARPERG
jgi:hypothetical protein